jgi:hypothetical protein
MKITLTSLSVFLLLMAVSCKKDNDNASNLDSMSGDYNVYRLVVEDPDDGPLTYPVPTPEGNTSKAVVKANKDSSMTVKIYVFSKQKDTLSMVSMSGRVAKAANGDLRFINGNNWQGTFLKNAEVELYPDATSTVYARK